MKVGIDARLYYESGVGRYIKNTLNELDKYCLEKSPADKFYIFLSPKAFVSLNFKSAQIVKVEVNAPWHSLKEQISFGKIINAHKLDVMHFTYFSLPILYRRKFVVTVHDLIINKFNTGKATTLPKPIYLLKRAAYKKVIKHAVKDSSFIISPSRATEKEILLTYKINKEKIVVIPEGIDPDINNSIKPKKTLPEHFMLYVGNAYPHKNLNRLINAFIKVQDIIPQELVLVGKEDFFYKRLRLKLKNNHNIHILHNISDENLSYLYKNADFLVAPSLMEGFGLTPLESMGHNLLPVVSDIDAFKEVCQNAALYFNPLDTQEIADTLVKASNLDGKKKIELVKKYKERISKFSWEESLKETLKVYERCNSL